MGDLLDWFAKGIKNQRFPLHWGDQEILALACWELDLAFHFFPAELHSGYLRTRLADPPEMLHAGGANKCQKLKKMLPFMQIAETAA